LDVDGGQKILQVLYQSVVRGESIVGVKGWRITGCLGWLCFRRSSGSLRTIELGLWGVSKVCLVLLFLTLNFLLLCQNSFLLLQERHVNENAVDEDLSFTI
jgi:hypothetical protein